MVETTVAKNRTAWNSMVEDHWETEIRQRYRAETEKDFINNVLGIKADITSNVGK